MKKVTDPNLINELSRTRHIQEHLSSMEQQPEEQQEMVEAPGALQTFGRSAFKAAPEAIGNLMMKFGMTSPETIQEAIYGKGEKGQKLKEEYERGEIAHPISSFLGGVAGFGPVGVGTSAGLRAIPTIGKAFRAASPSLLKRTGMGALEGGAIGGMYTPPGTEEEGVGLGALIGGALGGPGIGLARNIGKFREQGRNITNIEELGAQRKAAREAHMGQEELINALKKSYREQGIPTSPEEITHQISQRKGRIGELEEQANIPYEPTEDLLNYPTGEELVPHAMKQKEGSIKNIQDIINAETPQDITLDVATSKELMNSVESIKKGIQKEFFNPSTEYAEKNYVQVPRTPDVKLIDKQLSQISSDPIFQASPGFKKLKEEMVKAQTGRDLVKMTDFMGQWRETKNAAAQARSKGFQEGGSDLVYWQNKAEELQKLADQQLKILGEHLPEELFNKMLKGNDLWKENVIPFYGNKVYEQAKKGKFSFSDIPKELREQAIEEKPGARRVLDLFLTNPKLTKLALGHSHFENPEALLNPKRYEHAFIERLPELQVQLRQLSGHNRAINIAKAQHKLLQSERERTEIGHKEIVKKQAERQKAIKETNKLNNEIKDFERKLDKIEKEYKKGDITKEEFERLDKKYTEAIKNRKSVLQKTKKIVKYGLATAGILGGEHIIKELLK